MNGQVALSHFASSMMILLFLAVTLLTTTTASAQHGGTRGGAISISQNILDIVVDDESGPQHTNRSPPSNSHTSSTPLHRQESSSSEIGTSCTSDLYGSSSCTSSLNYCSTPLGKCDSGKVGTCQTKPQTCLETNNNPVCGCDRNTYDSNCSAQSQGVNVWHEGECEVGGRACSDEDPCDHNELYFCKFPPGMCGESPNWQRNHPHLTCTEYGSQFACATSHWAPVCGCDDIVYSNTCKANYQNGMNVLCSLNHEDSSVMSGGSCNCATKAYS